VTGNGGQIKLYVAGTLIETIGSTTGTIPGFLYTATGIIGYDSSSLPITLNDFLNFPILNYTRRISLYLNVIEKLHNIILLIYFSHIHLKFYNLQN
jgi:hypothetical protein